MKVKKTKLMEHVMIKTQLSRRKYFEYLRDGKIKVNGKVIEDINYEIQKSKDKVVVNGETISVHGSFDYYLYYKPKGVLSTMTDPKDRKCIGDLVREKQLTVSPVGRLDRQTTGLMILTNDGNLSYVLTHPKHKVKKIYHVTVDKVLTKVTLTRLIAGVILDDGPIQCDSIEQIEPIAIRICISEGRNRIVRRLFDHLGYHVVNLKRTSIGPLQLGSLKPGELKKITQKQLSTIQQDIVSI